MLQFPGLALKCLTQALVHLLVVQAAEHHRAARVEVIGQELHHLVFGHLTGVHQLPDLAQGHQFVVFIQQQGGQLLVALCRQVGYLARGRLVQVTKTTCGPAVFALFNHRWC